MKIVPILDPVMVYGEEFPSGVQGDPGGVEFPVRDSRLRHLGVFEIWDARPDRLIAMLSDPWGRVCFVEPLVLSPFNGGYAVERLRVADALAQTQSGSLEDHLASYDSGRIRHHYSDRLSGGIFTPVIAFWNYMFGGGVPYSVSIEELGINVKPNDLAQVKYLLRPGVTPGKYPINETIPFKPSPLTVPGSYLFGVKLQIRGELEVLGGGAGWKFSGSITASDAIYDLNLSENWDWLYDLPGKMFHRFEGQPYPIRIEGTLSLWRSGR